MVAGPKYTFFKQSFATHFQFWHGVLRFGFGVTNSKSYYDLLLTLNFLSN